MQRGRPAVASLFLCFVCMITVSSRLCSKDLIKGVNRLKQEAPNKKSLNCSLYTPTMKDYEQKCPNATMSCFSSEMDVLIGEWRTTAFGMRFRNQLRKLARNFNKTEPECLQCEVLKEENATTFLENLLLTLEKINSQHCQKFQ